MFEHIAVAYITPTKKITAFKHALSLAKKYDSKITLLEYFLKETPRFFFFETKKEQEIGKIQRSKIREQLEKFKSNALKSGVSLDIEINSTESIADSILNYVSKNNVDLLIVDHPHVSHIDENYYEDIVNTIHHEIRCDMLTLK